MRQRRTIAQLASAMIIAFCLFAPARTHASDREHQVKSGFVYSIAKFCDWDFSKKPGNRFVIGIYRTRAFDLDIDVLNGKTIRGRSVSVEQLRSEADIANCQVVIVGDVGTENIRHLVNLCKNSSTLLVGESEGFTRDGGTIGFVLRDGTVRFQVNLQTAQVDRVSISSKLLTLAEQVFR